MDTNIASHDQHKIICENRQKTIITGIQKADNATPTLFSCKVLNTNLNIYGQNLSVIKLDVVSGCAELCGQVNKIEYTTQKASLIKRLFK